MRFCTGLKTNFSIKICAGCLLGFFLGTLKVQAQLCSGALGDPIVNIDFGSGTGRGAALGSAITAYTYRASGDLGEGEYTIANTTAGLKGTAWKTTTDHTGNANGFMMVINSATLATEGVFYKKTVDGLCPNTTYEFSAWLFNVMAVVSPNPNVTFKIKRTDGTLIKTYDSGDLPITGKWVQSGFYFTTGSESSVVISISNNAPSAVPGNDLALDDITFRACGPIVTSGINSGNQTTATICAGTAATIELDASVTSGLSTPQYQWQVNANGAGWTDISGATQTSTTVQFANAVAGSYLYRLQVGEAANFGSTSCRVASPTLTVTVSVAVQATAASNGPLCIGETLNLTSSGGGTYSWIGPNNFSSKQQNPVVTTVSDKNAGTYTVTVTSDAGCTATAQTTVAIGSRPVVSVSPAVTLCQGMSTTLTASGGVSYKWTPATGLSNANIASPVASPTQTTTYKVTVSDATSACPAIDSITVTVMNVPVVSAGNDKGVVKGNSVQLKGSITGNGYTYVWTPSTGLNDATKLSPVAKPTQTTTYMLTATSTEGCGVGTDVVTVTVFEKLSIPNTFSPNGDGVNDVWNISGLDSYPGATLSIFNRNGARLYYSVGYPKAWNGTYNGSPLPVGTYYYLIDPRNNFSLLSGWVCIVR
ncbi:gliding motility-associated-like protein [Mucilaginibacter gracilis]|uniref:Gliding motility-associated-like protein n=2 Tax=Mucilaginibacter gracilis TaxID=423350 RepID=A0A495J8A8_9SPHI|nr:gliding motility-associated-like protein [Mucilaginibacter gracilis]